MIELVAIVNSFNRAALLKDALSSLAEALAKLPIKTAIIVVDAGSRDESVQTVERARRTSTVPVGLLELPGASFAAGVNAGVAKAIELHPTTRYLLLFETDNYVSSERPLLDALRFLDRRRSFAAAGFTVRKHDGSPAGFGCNHPRLLDFVLGPQVAFRLGLDRPRLKWKREDDLSWAECEVVYTSPILIRREAWTETGGFDAAEFPFSDCDVEWAHRLQRLGYGQAVLESVDVIHDNQHSLSSWSSSRALHFHRARLSLLRKKYGADVYAVVPLLLARHCGELLAALLDWRDSSTYRSTIAKRWSLLWQSMRGYR